MLLRILYCWSLDWIWKKNPTGWFACGIMVFKFQIRQVLCLSPEHEIPVHKWQAVFFQ
jgi:hypothetical protein